METESGGAPTYTPVASSSDGLSVSLSASASRRRTKSAASGRVCGALGCREDAEWKVFHPDYGDRVLCPDHADQLLEQPPQGRESGGAARDRWERASAERQSARERRNRRKRGLAPDPEARPYRGADGATDGSAGGTAVRASILCGEDHQPAARDSPADPPTTGTCLLRHLAGSAPLSLAGTATETLESGVRW